MSLPNTAYLKQALASTYKVEAVTKNQIDSDKATATATSFWLEKHSGHPWHIITVDLTLSSHLVSSLGPQYMSQRSLGIMQRHTLFDFNEPNTLVIYTSDPFTETWVHEWAQARTTHDSSRILNIVREDKDTIVDLGVLNIG